jgi:hypothetical protein
MVVHVLCDAVHLHMAAELSPGGSQHGFVDSATVATVHSVTSTMSDLRSQVKSVSSDHLHVPLRMRYCCIAEMLLAGCINDKVEHRRPLGHTPSHFIYVYCVRGSGTVKQVLTPPVHQQGAH